MDKVNEAMGEGFLVETSPFGGGMFWEMAPCLVVGWKGVK